MKYPAHLIGGLTFGVIGNAYLLQNLTFVKNSSNELLLGMTFICGSVLGSLMPDIDHPNSYIGKKLKPLSFIISKAAGHRGATHSPFIVSLIACLFSICALWLTDGIQKSFLITLIAGLASGAFSHIFLDSLTKGGVPFFYPFSRKPYRLARLKTGGAGEVFATIVMVCCLIGVAVYKSGDHIQFIANIF